MSWFSSPRERRLWICTLLVVAGIYSTLGLASTLAQLGLADSLAAIAFITCMVLVGLSVLTEGLSVRPGGVEIGVAIGIFAVYGFLFIRMALPERSHLIEYSVVAVFIYGALAERSRHGRWVPFPALLAGLATTLVGVVNECIQLLLPSRVFDWVDILFNTLAGAMAVCAMLILGWARRYARGKHPR